MTLAPEPGVIDGAVVPDAGDHILRHAPARDMEEHVIGSDGRNPCPRRHLRQMMEPQRIVRPPAQRQRHVAPVAKSLREPAQLSRAGVIGLAGNEDDDQALAIGDEIGPVEPASRLAAAPLAER